MKKSVLFLAVAIFLVIALTSNKTFAQFEQKFTLQAAGGVIGSIKPDMFTQAFSNGFSLDAGAQYNFNRSFGLVALAKFSTFLANDEFMLQDATYNLIGISLCPKIRLLSSGNTNPYLLGGVSLNYYKFKVDNMYDSPWNTKFGFIGGIGVDFSLNDNLAIFVQGGINGVTYNEMLIGWYTQIGFNLSMFKSKSL